jgi:hypothetical protein
MKKPGCQRTDGQLACRYFRVVVFETFQVFETWKVDLPSPILLKKAPSK